MKKLKVLLFGAAFSADLHADAYSRILDKVEIAGICDKDLSRVKALAERYGFAVYTAYGDFIDAIERCECDLVDVCMPNFLHHDVAVRALERGRDIICEKPLATTVEDAQDMVDTAARLKKHIYYAEDWLFAPAFRKAKEILASGKVGKPLYVRARESHCGSHSPFAQLIQYCGGGCMVHLGVHPVCFLLSLKNNEWSELVAMTSGGKEQNLVHSQMEGEDWAGAFVRFRDGTYATLEANYVTVGGMEDVMDIYCEQGCIHVDLSFSGPVKVFSIPGSTTPLKRRRSRPAGRRPPWTKNTASATAGRSTISWTARSAERTRTRGSAAWTGGDAEGDQPHLQIRARGRTHPKRGVTERLNKLRNKPKQTR
jgi:predicted dehydrogenase